jgi:hypothetical protein
MAREEEAAKKGKAGAEEGKSPATKETTNAESIKLIGGLVALGSGLLVLALIAGGALIAGTATAEKIAIGAFGVIGTLVGAYFGQKIGSDGSKDATERANQEATKAQIYAAHLPPNEATEVIKLAHAAATGEELKAPAPTPEHGSADDAGAAGEARAAEEAGAAGEAGAAEGAGGAGKENG